MRILVSVFALLLLVASCGKSPSELRFKEYPVEAVNTLGVTGTLYCFELNNGTTNVRTSLYGIVPGKTYMSHICIGSVTNYESAGATDMGNISNATDSSAVHEYILDMPYDELLAYDGCVIIHHPDSGQLVILRANIGINAP